MSKKFYVQAYTASDEPIVPRGKTSIDALATEDAIDGIIAQCAKRAGLGRTAYVRVTDEAGNEVRLWTKPEQTEATPADAAPAEPVEASVAENASETEQPTAQPTAQWVFPKATAPVAEPATEEDPGMAKKKTAKSVTKVPSERKNGSGAKVSQVIAMCERKNGCTIEDIVDRLGVSKQAAQSLIGDVRRQRKELKRQRPEGGGVSSYHL